MKYIKVTPPNGNAVVIPNNEANKRHFERLHEIHATDNSPTGEANDKRIQNK